MSIQEIVKDKLFMEMKKVEGTLDSCKACLSNDDLEQAMVRLQMMGVQFTRFECDVISESMEQS